MTNLSPDVVATPDAARRYWIDVLRSGGVTPVPRWAPDSRPGVFEHLAAVPDRLGLTVCARAAELEVPLRSVALAVHARVLALLSGAAEVTTGYVAVLGGQPLPCRLDTDQPSWRALVLAAARAEGRLRTHSDFPVAELARELQVPWPALEAVLDPTATADPRLAAETALWVSLTGGDRPALRLRYRGDVLDAMAAARIAGYYLSALRFMTADLDAEPGRQCLLSAEERRLALEGLAGPDAPLPDDRVHELFEARARIHPDAIAAVHGDRSWTYHQLNARANRLARGLVARGVGRDDVVAVVTERNLDWMSAVLAVFKAGGAYLPIEPHFPPERIAKMLTRAACRIALTESGATGTLDQALAQVPGVQRLLIDTTSEEGSDEEDLHIAGASDQLAYVYFTSGSTGEPKGAMCEHAGFLNHVLAKIEDLGIGEGDVVAQVAPQCFDISLWQLLSAVLVGGRTLIVEQEAVLDVERFIDRIRAGRVAVLQVVPSYLEALLSYLEQHPQKLPDLRCVSVTGEALKHELVERWFAGQPSVKLVNAYGLTETSDDTNHEVMDRPPPGDRVPLGRPVRNVRAYVVDEALQPVPLGAPGEIVFSGVCVGRGYINDPDRTQRAFLTDPHLSGRRLYRSGDYGRWRPDGKLEFLGRRDSQVKVRGFRIEIGEVENALLAVEGVRDCAVVVAGEAERTARLVAFYSSPRVLDAVAMRQALGQTLPDYMVPSVLHWRASLPVTANGKIDRKSLAAVAAELDSVASEEDEGAGTATEQRLIGAWATVLGIAPERIGRRHHFFDLGGTSLSAVKLAVALDRVISIRDLAAHPVLGDLAAFIDGRVQRRSELLQPLGQTPARPHTGLVCFPYAGGGTVSFQPLAATLESTGVAVYAVDLPGHDLKARDEPLAPLTDVVARVVDELGRLGLERLVLWGHSSGTAFAVETARQLETQGIEVDRVFLAAQLLGDIESRRAIIAEIEHASIDEIGARLAADHAFGELGTLDPQRARQITAAYRHDYLAASRHLAQLLESPPQPRLTAPVTVIAAADDPATTAAERRFREWEIVAERVELRELADGGHYFHRTRPEEAARAVREALTTPVRS